MRAVRETRLAVGALRGDAAAAPSAVEALVAEYRAESDAPAELTIAAVQGRTFSQCPASAPVRDASFQAPDTDWGRATFSRSAYST